MTSKQSRQDIKIKSIQRTGYVSEIDQFLKDFDQKNPHFPQSRVQEIAKFKKIFAKRDGVVEPKKPVIWEKF